MSAQLPAKDCYELRVAEHLDERWSAWFGEMDVVHEDDGGTTLRGCVADQAELHGVLGRVRDLGLTLLSLGATDAAQERLDGRRHGDRTSNTEGTADDRRDSP